MKTRRQRRTLWASVDTADMKILGWCTSKNAQATRHWRTWHLGMYPETVKLMRIKWHAPSPSDRWGGPGLIAIPA